MLGVLGACCGCRAGSSAGPAPPPGTSIERLAVTSDSFASNGAIPVDFTCDGANRSPELTFSTPPRGTQSLVVIVEDPDAPGGTFTHFTLYGLRPDTLSLPQGVDAASLGACSGLNDFQRPGYSGPCPPRMELHRYYFRVFALNTRLALPPDALRSTLDAAMNGHVLAEGTLVGEFSR